MALDGQITEWIFLLIIFQKSNLKKFNFGNPEILKIKFVLKLKIKKIKSGNEVIKWTIK